MLEFWFPYPAVLHNNVFSPAEGGVITAADFWLLSSLESGYHFLDKPYSIPLRTTSTATPIAIPRIVVTLQLL